MTTKLIALDLDHTTLRPGGVLSDEVRAALEYAVSKGVHVVIASGRPCASMPESVTGIAGVEYAITNNGAAIYHLPSGKCLRRQTLLPASVEAILAQTADEGITYEAFIDGHAYALDAYIDNPLQYGATQEDLTYLRLTRHKVPDIVNFVREHMNELDSLDVVVPNPEVKQRLWDKLAATVPDVYITTSVRRLLELSHRDGGKHSGVAFVADLLGIDMQDVAAFGDGDNDIGMLRAAGCGIAVANATPKCLAAADIVTLSNEEDGVAHAIYEILKI